MREQIEIHVYLTEREVRKQEQSEQLKVFFYS